MADALHVVEESLEEPSVPRGVGLLMALTGLGLLLNFSLKRLPLRCVLGSLFLIGGGRLLWSHRE